MLNPNHVNLRGDFCNGDHRRQKAVLNWERTEQTRGMTQTRDRAGTRVSALRLYATPKTKLKSHPRRLQELTQILLTLEKPGG